MRENLPTPRHRYQGSPATGPERRQVTVMFCDLVGSTPLSQTLDPEDLLEVLTLYRKTCIPVISRFGGFVSRFMGDGILALFGYPIAHEDDAERAALAGLGIVEGLGALNESVAWLLVSELRVRIGIATGLVIAGDRIGEGASEEEAIVGEAPNLAARLQGLAQPNAVVVSQSTHRLLGGRFECRDLGRHQLKGFAELQQVWQVLRSHSVGSRFEAAHASTLIPLVDRLDVMGVLSDRWQKALRSDMQIVLMLGEPGIGKSRVTQELRDRARESPHTSLRYQCSPYYTNTAFYPIIDHLWRSAGFEHRDAPAVKLDKLNHLLSRFLEDTSEVLPLLASLLSIPYPDPDILAGMSPERRKEKTIEALIQQARVLATQQPLLIIFEDVHWIDPTTLELIGVLLERIKDLPVFAVLTSRPGFSASWIQDANVSLVTLDRLDRNYGETLVERVIGGKSMPPFVIEQICQRTDGVPLFLEELTKTLLDSDYLEEREGAYVVAGKLPTRAIPDTLQDSLMARLDQLSDAKIIAQIGAAIGREFSIGMLKALARFRPEFSESALEAGLQRLIDADLVLVRGTLSQTIYSFKHTLVRDAAYDSLLRRQREQIHSQIVSVLEEQFHDVVETQPELLAYHCSEAGRYQDAVEYWLKAGVRAAEGSANIEAVRHLQNGLALLPRIVNRTVSDRLDLALRVALGAPLISTRGPGSREVEKNYDRAVQLCAHLPESEAHFKAHWGWWRVSMNHRLGRERADTMLALAKRLNEPGLLLQAHHCQWATLFHLGDYTSSRRHVEAGLALYDPQIHCSQASVYGGHDAKVCALGERALSLWLEGWSDQATEQVHRSLLWAETLGHVGSVVHARDYALLLSVYRQDIPLVGKLAEEMIEFAKSEGLPDCVQRGLMYQGWALARCGEVAEGQRQMRDALGMLRTLGTKEDLPMFLDMMAQVEHSVGNTDKGLECIDEAFAESREAGILFWLAELHRCRTVLRLDVADEGEIEAGFRKALDVAHEQGALAFELRAAENLADWYQRQGQRERAGALLGEVYSRFEEGLDSPDLRRVKALLEALN